jgi:hypothetical protein
MEMSSSHRGSVESSSGIVDEVFSMVVIVEKALTNAITGTLLRYACVYYVLIN